jgi:hypothetical protein
MNLIRPLFTHCILVKYWNESHKALFTHCILVKYWNESHKASVFSLQTCEVLE